MNHLSCLMPEVRSVARLLACEQEDSNADRNTPSDESKSSQAGLLTCSSGATRSLPGTHQWPDCALLAAYSCGGSSGFPDSLLIALCGPTNHHILDPVTT